MKCEICQNADATVHFKQVSGGTVKELYVCEDCAAENGFDLHAPLSMPDFLFGGGGEARRADSAEKACPVCGLRGKDYRKRALLGCPACYEAFADELKPYLQAMQKGGRHTGKAPAGARLDAELEGLQAALNRAVEVQDFEEAAALRDRIRALHAAPGDGGDDAGG